MRKKILFCRWGGAVAIDLDEVSSANSATLDFFLVKRLTELGYDVDLCMTSKFTNDAVKSKKHDFYKYVDVIDAPLSTDEYSYIFILQGTTNYRFGGWKGIPTQLVTYRFMRTAKCPIFYVQYDANTQMHLPPCVRDHKDGAANSYFGCTIREMLNCNITILSVGRNMQYYDKDDVGYRYVFDYVKFDHWKHDLHAIAIPIVKDYSLKVNENPDNVIAFVGKDRVTGSKRGTISSIGNALVDADMSEYKVRVYGDWGKFLKDIQEKPQRVDNTEFCGKIKGLNNVLEAYNKAKFAILAHNEFNLELQQYTVRTFEVIAGGAVPLISKVWFEQWKDIFTEEYQKKLEELCFDEIEDIPGIIKNFDQKYPGEKRVEFINGMRESLLTVLSDDYVNKELIRTLDDANKSLEFDHEKAAVDVLNRYMRFRTHHTLRRIREDAENLKARIIKDEYEIEHNLSEATKKMLPKIDTLFYFEFSEIGHDDLVKRFGR